ncbi:hypothetical protein AVEN_102529-1 [Araneus ventricosus]|uniref:Uncharacterized protein n=1 Tax=Araneus ventricosus TaxID=182803 RepID=A0A4Y2BI67_ARAVE|nr:hypothetical protein AVEN_102529-1 [Araneus ventricosus]
MTYLTRTRSLHPADILVESAFELAPFFPFQIRDTVTKPQWLFMNEDRRIPLSDKPGSYVGNLDLKHHSHFQHQILESEDKKIKNLIPAYIYVRFFSSVNFRSLLNAVLTLFYVIEFRIRALSFPKLELQTGKGVPAHRGTQYF